MVHFVGAGPGAVDLITVRGRELIEKADVIIYAGSLVNPALLEFAREGIECLNGDGRVLQNQGNQERARQNALLVGILLLMGLPCLAELLFAPAIL